MSDGPWGQVVAALKDALAQEQRATNEAATVAYDRVKATGVAIPADVDARFSALLGVNSPEARP